jgi:zinc transport system ATP-binding protein
LASAEPSAARPPPAIRLERVSVEVEDALALEEVTAVVPARGFTAVVGPNGAGKTTLLHAILGLRPHRGTIALAGPGGQAPRIGYVPQRLTFDRGTPLTVEELLVLGWQRRPIWLGLRRSARARAQGLLEAVDAGHLRARPLGALSGGELQRVLLALALGQDPELLVLDEPAAGLDARGELLLCGLLERLRGERGFTLLMVTHDLGLALHHASHVLLLHRRLLAEGTPASVLTPENLSCAYGAHMGGLASSPAAGEVACHG